MTAHLFGGLQPAAHSRAFRLAKQAAPVIPRQVNTAHARRFPIRHSWQRRWNGRSNATRPTAHSALHTPLSSLNDHLMSGGVPGYDGFLPQFTSRPVYHAIENRRTRVMTWAKISIYTGW